MTEDVGTTPRKPLTPTQRLKLFERKRGICDLCGLKITGSFIDEHMIALGLGGSNDSDNRGIAHPLCAEAKTRNEDMPRIVKAKAQKRAQHGIKPVQSRPIQSPGFRPTEKPEKKPLNLPPGLPGIFRQIATAPQPKEEDNERDSTSIRGSALSHRSHPKATGAAKRRRRKAGGGGRSRKGA